MIRSGGGWNGSSDRNSPGQFAMTRFVVLVLLVLGPLANSRAASADEIKVKKVSGKAPKGKLTVVGSGSGVVVGPGLVLTNRHVVQEGDHPNPGFRVRVGPKYTKALEARAIWICETYDLALLKTDASLTSDLKILDGLAPLGTSVTAYGFPLGDAFGIGLTLTGGQVTRHPVDAGGPAEDAGVRRSLWHDAVTAGGSSGGPLVSRNGVLVGVHFASLTVAKGQALAVPSSAVAAFLRTVDPTGQRTFVDVGRFASTAAAGDPKSAVVYVEILGLSAPAPSELAKSEAAKFSAAIVSEIENFLPAAPNDALTKIEKGELSPAYKITPPAEVQPMTIARIAGEMTVIQILADGMLVRMGSVKFKMFFPNGGGAELRARLGDDIITGVREDDVFIVGRATEYATARRGTSFYIPLFSARAIADRDRIAMLVRTERARRAEVQAEDEKRQAALAADRAEKKKRAEIDEALKTLRRSFADASGMHHVDAVAVKIADNHLQLVRMDNFSPVSIGLAELSDADEKWLGYHAKYIRTHGQVLIDYFEEKKQKPAGMPGGTVAAGGSAASVPPATPDAGSAKRPETIELELPAGAVIRLKLIPAGKFVMGTPGKPVPQYGGREMSHGVAITRPFYIGVTEVTQAQWTAVMGTNPSLNPGDPLRPVESIAWNDCQQFLERLNGLEAGKRYRCRLPTEAEWEYACRAGTTTTFSFGDDMAQLPEYGWLKVNTAERLHPVAQLKANPWGLYDMHGGVWEWCNDWHSGDYYSQSPADDPPGPATGTHRVLRGGSWLNDPGTARSAYRNYRAPDVGQPNYGLRVVSEVPSD
jgi:formylglycine-generating enzyme required for sulfatase activity/S1-C subfamily serine protease